MGDYTNGQMIVYSCPPDQAGHFLSFADEHGLGLDWSSNHDADRTSTLHLGVTYGDNDVSVGMVDGATLHEKAPDSYYMIWTDPKYEFLGSLEIHVPDLGLYNASCDADGNAVLRIDTILGMIDALPDNATKADVQAAIAMAHGKPWLEAISAIKAIAALVDQPKKVIAMAEGYYATFSPEAWQNDQAVPVDPEGKSEWDCTAQVKAHWDYFLSLANGERVDNVLDRDDILKSDPAAPKWVREWAGPFTIRIHES